MPIENLMLNVLYTQTSAKNNKIIHVGVDENWNYQNM